jgi:putative protein-disulfide isomerase
MRTICTSDGCAIDNEDSALSGNPSFEPGPGKHVLLFADPMCSWCWGFAPEADKVRAATQERAQFHVVMGGLRPGTREPWDKSMRHDIRHHWQQVQSQTGQPFNFDRFEDPNFVYDTEPACRAVVAVRLINAALAPLMLEALHKGFYAKGLNITETTTLGDIAHTTGVHRDEFLYVFTSDVARKQIAFDFSRTRAFGVSGFPTLVCADNGQYAYLSNGYRPYDALQPLLEEWLNA